nr:TerY-C metal binding domain-containing protein [Massilia oculi]
MRRLPIFMLLDVSESMAGDNLRQLQQGLERLVAGLRTDPHALETVHLSAIVFAGKARTLCPLTELAQFYPPRLPLGSGTSLGRGMQHLMDELDRTVLPNTPQRKGDWRPVIYLMTDGKPTDDVEPAIQRWHARYANRASLVAIAVGKFGAVDVLRRFTDTVLSLDARSEQDFKRFVDWVTMSVVAQSRSVTESGTGPSLARLDTSILKKIGDIEGSLAVDEDLVVLSARCQTNRLPYLMRYERIRTGIDKVGMALDLYQLNGVFALEQDYAELSDERAMARTVSTDALLGAPGCPTAAIRSASRCAVAAP